MRSGREQDHPYGPQREGKPGRLPDTTPPPAMPSGDYSYVLEIVMQMQHSMGQLSEAVNGLKSKQEEQGKKLDSISHKVYAAVAIVLLFGAILTFFAKSINDAITNRLLAPIYLQQPTPTPSAIPTPARSR